MRVRLAFRHEEEHDRFIVTARIDSPNSSIPFSLTANTTYSHEDSFLEALIAADLDEVSTQKLVVAAILSVAQPEKPRVEVQLDITPEQVAVIGLNLRQNAGQAEKIAAEKQAPPFSFQADPKDFHNFLLSSPTPFVMLEGPDHVFTFINQAYVNILGRTSPDELLGRPVREALPELVGQVCLDVLDLTYKSGINQVRRELLNKFRQTDTGLVEAAYFDIVYQPMRDHIGNISGIMAQATDVTERVLSRQVSENREQNLYRLWAELGTIYQSVPLPLMVVSAADLRILRLNTLQAELLGGTVDSLSGTLLTDLPFAPPDVIQALKHAAKAKTATNLKLEILCQSCLPDQPKTIRVRSTLDASGAVETLILITLPASYQDEEDGPDEACVLVRWM
jgi:PAS domain S-box-containing protein